jgi:hypothetical protein
MYIDKCTNDSNYFRSGIRDVTSTTNRLKLIAIISWKERRDVLRTWRPGIKGLRIPWAKGFTMQLSTR